MDIFSAFRICTQKDKQQLNLNIDRKIERSINHEKINQKSYHRRGYDGRYLRGNHIGDGGHVVRESAGGQVATVLIDGASFP